MTSERKFIEENVKRVLLKEYLRRKTERSGFGGLDIQRTPMGTRVTLIAERPGMVIGRKGETIKELTDYVQNEFSFDNPQIEVKEVSNPNLNPHIMAQKLANALERGWHFRRAGHSTVRRIMSAGAKGCQVIISGKLTGQRHRTEKFREGHIKYCGETKLQWMHEGYAVAKKKLGVIGVKVQIMDPKAKLPDEIEFHELREVAEIKIENEIKPEPLATSESEGEAEIKSDGAELTPEVEVDAEARAAVADSEIDTEKATKDTKEVEHKKDQAKEKGPKKKDKDTEKKAKEPEVETKEIEHPEENEPKQEQEQQSESEPKTESKDSSEGVEDVPENIPEDASENATEKDPETDTKGSEDSVKDTNVDVDVEGSESDTAKSEKNED